MGGSHFTVDNGFNAGTTMLTSGQAYVFEANDVTTSHPFAVGYYDASSKTFNRLSDKHLTGTGEKFTITVPSPLTQDLYYYCVYHPSMRQKIAEGTGQDQVSCDSQKKKKSKKKCKKCKYISGPEDCKRSSEKKICRKKNKKSKKKFKKNKCVE